MGGGAGRLTVNFPMARGSRRLFPLISGDAVQHAAARGFIAASARAKALALQSAQMEYRQLGSSGMRVSCLGLGCFAFAGDKSTGSHLGKASDSALHPALRSFSDA